MRVCTYNSAGLFRCAFTVRIISQIWLSSTVLRNHYVFDVAYSTTFIAAFIFNAAFNIVFVVAFIYGVVQPPADERSEASRNGGLPDVPPGGLGAPQQAGSPVAKIYR